MLRRPVLASKPFELDSVAVRVRSAEVAPAVDSVVVGLAAAAPLVVAAVEHLAVVVALPVAVAEVVANGPASKLHHCAMTMSLLRDVQGSFDRSPHHLLASLLQIPLVRIL